MPLSRLLALGTAALTLALASPAAAQTFTVTTTLDGPAACTPAACTLRAAVTAANGDAAADVIVLGPGAYRLPLGEIVIAKDVTVRGAGPDATRIEAGPNARIFSNGAATVTTLEGLTLTGVDRLSAAPGDGGAVLNAGTLTLDHVAVIGNRIAVGAPAVLSGGGVSSSGPLTIRDSQIAGNAVLAAAGSIPQGGGISTTGTTVIERSTIADNEVATSGVGGIPQGAGIMASSTTLTVSASRIERNRAVGGSIPQGGGIGSTATDVVLTDVVLSGNVVRAPSGGSIAQASAVFALNKPLTIIRSAITDNVSVQDGGVGGGGIADGPIFLNVGALTLTSSTVANNTARGDNATSSAVTVVGAASSLAVNDSTITGNAAAGTGSAGAVRVLSGATSAVRNTILAGNTSNGALLNCENATRPASAGHNLTDDASCSFAGTGDKIGDPRLGPLGANGGPTPTRALLAGSPAIDAGDPTTCATTDQRGVGRNGTCDIGAYEFVTPPIPPTPPAPPAPPAPVAPAAKPLPALKAASVLRLPSSKACLSRRQLRVTLRLPAGARAKDVVVTIGKRRVPAFAGKRLRAPIDLRGLPKGTFKVRVTLRTLDGRTATLTRTYRTCATKRKR